LGLIASLPEIDRNPRGIFVMHEKSEKIIPWHKHTKGQLSYVEGGIAYLTIGLKTFIIPARHYFWVPRGISHLVRIGYAATAFRSLYFYAHDDKQNIFYGKLGIYPASDLLIEMVKYTERWDGQMVNASHENFEFLVSIKNILPKLSNRAAPIVLPTTDNDLLLRIFKYLEKNIDSPHSLNSISEKFNLSARSVSRLFQGNLHMSFLQYLKTLRIIKAMEMLLKTNKNISEIAFDVGYETLSAFSNTFYSFNRVRPSDFRKSIK
jgi:AraC-like DNA-binding protein